MPNTDTQLAGFYARYEPAIARLGKAVRAKLRARLPGLHELVYMYEKQDAFVITYSPTGHGAAGVCGVSLYPDRVSLFFTGGAQLSKADPNGLLQGRGKMARQVVLTSMADFDRPEIEVLIAAALKLSKVRLDANATTAVIVKAEEQKQRARRAAKQAARPASKRRTESQR